jgi:hypothetical protein
LADNRTKDIGTSRDTNSRDTRIDGNIIKRRIVIHSRDANNNRYTTGTPEGLNHQKYKEHQQQ